MQENGTQKHRSWKWPILGSIFLILTGGVLVILMFTNKEPWPAADLLHAKSRIDYPLYYPTELPKGFSYKKNSIKISEIATIYTLTYEKDKKLFISNQPKPKEVIFKDFYDRLLKNKADVTSNQGKAVTGIVADQSVGSLVTDKTWVILNAPNDIKGQDLTDIVSSLSKL
jgi:hypothetical protein